MNLQENSNRKLKIKNKCDHLSILKILSNLDELESILSEFSQYDDIVNIKNMRSKYYNLYLKSLQDNDPSY